MNAAWANSARTDFGRQTKIGLAHFPRIHHHTGPSPGVQVPTIGQSAAVDRGLALSSSLGSCRAAVAVELVLALASREMAVEVAYSAEIVRSLPETESGRTDVQRR